MREPAAGIYKEVITVTTTGNAGAATGDATSNVINGELLSIHFDFHASAPSTTDTTVSYVNPATGNILVITSSATDLHAAPRMGAVTAANAAITDSHAYFPLAGTIKVALAECDALTAAVVATVYYRKG